MVKKKLVSLNQISSIDSKYHHTHGKKLHYHEGEKGRCICGLITLAVNGGVLILLSKSGTCGANLLIEKSHSEDPTGKNAILTGEGSLEVKCFILSDVLCDSVKDSGI